MKNQSQLKADIEVLESAVRLLTKSLNELVANCHDDKGKLIAPDKKAVVKARTYLPLGYSMTLIKSK